MENNTESKIYDTTKRVREGKWVTKLAPALFWKHINLRSTVTEQDAYWNVDGSHYQNIHFKADKKVIWKLKRHRSIQKKAEREKKNEWKKVIYTFRNQIAIWWA